MKYAIRNSIILIVILLIVVLSFHFSSSSNVKEVVKLKKSYQDNLALLENLRTENPNMEEQFKIEFVLNDLHDKKRKTGKYLLKKEDPTFSYQYFLDICDKYSAELNFDFNILKTTNEDKQSFNTYVLTGTSTISSIYTFLYNLEKQYLLYIITDIDLSEESTEDRTIKYVITIQAYHSESGTVENESPWRALPKREISYNPLFSRIHSPIIKKHEEKFIDIEKSTVIGLSIEKAFLVDESGSVQVLSIGDKVAYGYLDYIDIDKQFVQFRLNQIGIDTKHKLYLEKE